MAYDFMNEFEEADEIIVLGKLKSASNLVSEEGCNTCPAKYPLHYKDKRSYKEWKVAGMCQKCQDEVFKVPNRLKKAKKLGLNFND